MSRNLRKPDPRTWDRTLLILSGLYREHDHKDGPFTNFRDEINRSPVFIYYDRMGNRQSLTCSLADFLCRKEQTAIVFSIAFLHWGV